MYIAKCTMHTFRVCLVAPPMGGAPVRSRPILVESFTETILIKDAVVHPPVIVAIVDSLIPKVLILLLSTSQS